MSKFDFIKRNKYTKAGFWTTLIAGICCFTPLLVWGFAFAGLAAFTAYIDYVILPIFFIGLSMVAFGYRKDKKSG
ncbi:MAG: mercury resistance system transport protein MerF [Bacteroidetes bacterium]|jgi:mercuric ion transport protein|nr:mercury resistance system transport protein MerF [Bacteroidota bacterium]